jgi:hypothetical protein
MKKAKPEQSRHTNYSLPKKIKNSTICTIVKVFLEPDQNCALNAPQFNLSRVCQNVWWLTLSKAPLKSIVAIRPPTFVMPFQITSHACI